MTEEFEIDIPEQDALGIDIGMKNLALCRLHVTIMGSKPHWRISYWDVVDLTGLDKNLPRLACESIPRTLASSYESFKDCKHIVIEQQPHTNVPMRIVSHALITYFQTCCLYNTAEDFTVDTIISSASNKLKPFEEANTKNYYQRKKSAVQECAKLLNAMVLSMKGTAYEQQHIEYAKWFAQLGKRDDAADALLHAYYWLDKRFTTELKKQQRVLQRQHKQRQKQKEKEEIQAERKRARERKKKK